MHFGRLVIGKRMGCCSFATTGRSVQQVPDTAGPFGLSGGDNTITVALANYGSGVQALGELIGIVCFSVCVDQLQSVPSAFLHINQAPWLFAAGAFFPWLFAGGFSPWLVALDFTVAWCCGWAV